MTDPDETLRERLSRYGAEVLTDAELIAVLLGAGSDLRFAERLLAYFGGLRGLGRAEYADLCHVEELRPMQAARLLAAAEVGRRLASHTEDARPIINGAADAARLLALEMEKLKQEQLRVLLLDAHRRVLAIPTIYIGSLNLTVVRAAEVFREAIARNCASLILVHNHPSGDPTPSPSDVVVTETLVAAGKLLEIAVLDHVIIGHGAWVSLRDTGVAF